MTRIALAILALCILAPEHVRASEMDLLNVAFRARLGEKKVVGEVAPESFQAYDLGATFRLPWESYSASGWGTGTRLMASAGVLHGGHTTALVLSVLPVLAFGSQDGRFTFDLGAGLALLSRTKYAQQDFGGNLQGALTFGIGIPLYQRVGVGYRFMHYSDAGVYGNHTIGVDFHMLELIYRF